MDTTEELFRQHLATITKDKTAWLALLNADATVEFPFAAGIGLPDRLSGVAEIKAYIESLPPGSEDFEFSDLRIYRHADPNSLSAEFRGSIPAKGDRPGYQQKYVCLFATKDGKISQYKEFWDPNEVTKYIRGRA
jgi:hypothetical protein